jgi:nucleoside-diphosphate-sugar epimerase
MASVAKKLVVCGGNGFLGSRICKYAVARGWDVTSIRYANILETRQLIRP